MLTGKDIIEMNVGLAVCLEGICLAAFRGIVRIIGIVIHPGSEDIRLVNLKFRAPSQSKQVFLLKAGQSDILLKIDSYRSEVSKNGVKLNTVFKHRISEV